MPLSYADLHARLVIEKDRACERKENMVLGSDETNGLLSVDSIGTLQRADQRQRSLGPTLGRESYGQEQMKLADAEKAKASKCEIICADLGVSQKRETDLRPGWSRFPLISLETCPNRGSHKKDTHIANQELSNIAFEPAPTLPWVLSRIRAMLARGLESGQPMADLLRRKASWMTTRRPRRLGRSSRQELHWPSGVDVRGHVQKVEWLPFVELPTPGVLFLNSLDDWHG